MSQLNCITCGKVVSSEYSGDLVVRAVIQCPECVDKDTEDVVNHPPHYNQHPSGVECIAITEHFNFNVGNAIKYLWRAGLKGGKLEDLRKAAWYVQREIQRLEGKKE